ncbi:MAG: lyase family protein [Sporichthyaceae bacterium]
MSDLFWPGDERAGDHLTDARLVAAMVEVEEAWLVVLGHEARLPRDLDPGVIGADAEAGGNPVIPLVAALRHAVPEETGRLLHRGLTSQDVLDSALMLSTRDATGAVRAALEAQVTALVALVETHRDTPMVARTLTQHAVPITFGLKAATWLSGVLDARDDVAALTFPVQCGGAAGTMAGIVEIGLDPSAARSGLAQGLGLADALPWHTNRSAVTRIGDALTRCTDAWSRIANDVLTLSRPEIGELSEGTGGGSSTMPHKANPVLSTLVRRAALTTPHLAATLHAAAADQTDERAAGAWHAEWATLRTLVRRVLVAAGQTNELLTGLQVHPDRMAQTLGAARDAVHAEQQSLAEVAGHQPTGDYLGAAGALADAVLVRAQEAPR